MRNRMKVEPGPFRVEVWFDESTDSIQIKRTDSGVDRQPLSCTFEQWEQIKYAVDHLFVPAEVAFSNYPDIHEVMTASRN